MKKSVFCLTDFLFAIPAILATALSVWITINGFETNASPATVYGLMYTLSALFWCAYGFVVYQRWQFVKSITFVTKHGWNVITNGLAVSQEEVEDEVDRTLTMWKARTTWSSNSWSKIIDGVNSDWVLFCEPDTIDSKLGTLAGYVCGKHVSVGYIGSKDIQQTALAHETGHIIHYLRFGVWDNDGCHKFMKEIGVP